VRCFLWSLGFSIVRESLQGEISIVLELPNQKTRGFLVLIAFKRLLLEHVQKVFDEITVMI
jgi:hypothetical protein